MDSVFVISLILRLYGLTEKITIQNEWDNGLQFTGSMNGMFPFCGVRPGGAKPEPCMGK